MAFIKTQRRDFSISFIMKYSSEILDDITGSWHLIENHIIVYEFAFTVGSQYVAV